MGQGTVTSHRGSVVGANGMKLYVVEYVAVPPVISSGTDIDSSRVEFSPGTVGSGKKDMDVSLNSDNPFEQSDTVAELDTKRLRIAIALKNLDILY